MQGRHLRHNRHLPNSLLKINLPLFVPLVYPERSRRASLPAPTTSPSKQHSDTPADSAPVRFTIQSYSATVPPQSQAPIPSAIPPNVPLRAPTANSNNYKPHPAT